MSLPPRMLECGCYPVVPNGFKCYKHVTESKPQCNGVSCEHITLIKQALKQLQSNLQMIIALGTENEELKKQIAHFKTPTA